MTEEQAKRELEEFKQHKKERVALMVQLQSLPYEIKVKKAENRVKEYMYRLNELGYNAHISVGGLDSITLTYFIRSLGYKKEDIPAIGVSALEDKSIQEVHKELDVIPIAPLKSKVEVLNDYGFPVISKKIANKIETLQKPTENNKTIRHAIITGDTGEQGHFSKNSRMKLPKKWLELFAGYENENEGVNYQIAPFKVSSRCCEFMKEKPCDIWAKEHNSKPFLGLMASEGGQRQDALIEHGCNYFGKSVIRSAPFAPFMRNDILQLALDLGVHVPEIYGEIKRDMYGNLFTTGAQRTGCSMCGFGIHMEKRPHRFDKLRERNPKEWEFYMYKCCTDPDTGEKYGWGRVLDYIGVEWEDEYHAYEQMTIFDFMEGKA